MIPAAPPEDPNQQSKQSEQSEQSATESSPASPGRDAFGPFEDQTWLNTAHQGALSRAAAAAANEAVEWKRQPWRLTAERFDATPRDLRSSLGDLLDLDPDDVILGNSASYGLHLVASAFRWQAGDEVLLVEGDFPSTQMPWLLAREAGVHVRRLKPAGPVVRVEEVEAALTPRTRWVCSSWVFSFTGWALDLEAIADLCASRQAHLMVNASQALGARPKTDWPTGVSALTSVGFKWLGGPYGTGFCWIRPEVRDDFRQTQAYWLAQQTATDLGAGPGSGESPLEIRSGLGARAWDVFGTANFFQFRALKAAVDCVRETGLNTIAAYDQFLVDRLLRGLDDRQFEVISPPEGRARSTLVLLRPRTTSPQAAEALQARLQQRNIHVALRKGMLRAAPHFYNTVDDIDALLDAFADLGVG